MQKQAIILANREVPLVTTAIDPKGEKTYDELIGEEFGKPIKSEIGGTVHKITDTHIIVKDDKGNEHAHQIYTYFPLNHGFINNEVKVKVGDKVKKGDMMAEGWQTKEGKLALGTNARIGYIPYKGYNYEDGVVVSDSFAKRMATEELEDEVRDIASDWIGGKGSNVLPKLLAKTPNPKVKATLDNDGIIRVGEKVGPGSILVGILRPSKDMDDYGISNLLGSGKNKSINYDYVSLTIPSTSIVEGVVKRVTAINNPEAGIKQRIIITLVTSKPLKLGDKIAGRHGNKGTITKILSDDLMPSAEDGKSLDLMFSPLAVPSRKNVGQLLETNAGLIAEKTGKPMVINNFDHNEKKRIEDALKEIGIPDGKMKVFIKDKKAGSNEIENIPLENPVTVGNMYIMKLKHKVDDKMQSRSNLESKLEKMTLVPGKEIGNAPGEKHNPQSLGEMEMRALQAHGAVWNILENSTIKSDGGGDRRTRVAIFRALQTGNLDQLDIPATPETLNVLSDTLKTLGLNIKPINNGSAVKSFDDVFDSLKITPIKPSEMVKMIGKNNEVTKPVVFNAKPPKKGEEAKVDEVYKGGLADPNIFGDDKSPDFRTKWGYVKLATPMPNPLFLQEDSYNPYAMLTGISKNKLVDMMKGKYVMVIDPAKYDGFNNMAKDAKQVIIAEYTKRMKEAGLKPGELVAPQDLEEKIAKHGDILWKAGGEGLQHTLDNIDLESEIAKTSEQLKKTDKPKDLDRLYKKYRTLASLKSNNLQPSDLMWHYIPVAPLYLRPALSGENGEAITSSDLNELYMNLIKQNNPLKEVFDNGFDIKMSGFDPADAARSTAGLYQKLTQLSGHEPVKNRAGKPLSNVKDRLGGKEGLIRDKMLAKRVDFSGRSVIGVDPNLKLNEVGLPVEMARYLYKPFILRELVRTGRAQNDLEAQKKWEKLDSDTMQVIKDVAAHRPVILNRQPSLHKFSLQAFKPIIKDKQDGEVVRSIHLNPMVVTGFNADFDGDTMAVHVPVTEKAREEAIKLMMPSQNLINPTNGSMLIEIRHEMALGIYYLTMSKNKATGKGINYGNDYNKMVNDYMTGKIKANTKVTCGTAANVTAGQAMYNLILPEKYRDKTYSKTWTKKEVGNMLLSMYKDGEAGGWKTISKQDLSNVIDKIKDLGFKAATRAGVSIGVGDFKEIEDAEKIFAKHVEEARGKYKDEEQAMIHGYLNAQEEIEKKLKKGMILEEDNPIQIMMASGARAKEDQIRRMMVTVGVGRDVTNKLTQPVKHSHLDGLAPQEYWLHSYDARKGLYDRSVSTEAPGKLTREVWSATQDMIIKERDCGTHNGIEVPKNNATIVGRFTTEPIIGKNGIICKANQMITADIRNVIFKDDTITKVNVRSPLRCKVVGGICQHCYGTMPGTMQVPDLGAPVGILASQAMGEPVTQMTMNTFHSGGTSSSATLGLPRVIEILNLSQSKDNSAELATVSGPVTKVEKGPKGTFDTVYINNTAHKVPHYNDGESKKLRVKIGDRVTKGDFLTIGNIEDMIDYEQDKDIVVTNANPKQMFELLRQREGVNNPDEEALNYTQDYLSGNMEYVFNKTIGQGNIDRRHLETVISKLTSKVRVMDAGDSSFIKGQVVDKTLADKWNAEHSGAFSAKKMPMTSSNGIVGAIIAQDYKNKAGQTIIKKGSQITKEVFSKLLLSGIKEV
jgi:DNA-directed RNA polymerase subunit beta'